MDFANQPIDIKNNFSANEFINVDFLFEQLFN